MTKHISTEDFKARLAAIAGPLPASERPGRLLVRGPGDELTPSETMAAAKVELFAGSHDAAGKRKVRQLLEERRRLLGRRKRRP